MGIENLILEYLRSLGPLISGAMLVIPKLRKRMNKKESERLGEIMDNEGIVNEVEGFIDKLTGVDVKQDVDSNGIADVNEIKKALDFIATKLRESGLNEEMKAELKKARKNLLKAWGIRILTHGIVAAVSVIAAAYFGITWAV